eukprot:3195393-Pyramimonas_sp.AAC.1
MANRRPICVVCPFHCRTTSLHSIAPDSSQARMLLNRSHSVCKALRASWLTHRSLGLRHGSRRGRYTPR